MQLSEREQQHGMTRFAIVVPNRNGERLLPDMLANLSQAVRDSDEIVIVDNGSTDRSLSVIEHSDTACRVLYNNCNRGFGAACNQAVESPDATYVVLLNTDSIVSPDILDRLEETFRGNPDCAVISPQLAGPDGEPQRSYGFAPTPGSECGIRGLTRKRTLKDNGGRFLEVETVVGACMAVRRAAIDEVGLLDEDFFFYFEETEWCHRFRQHGWKVLLDRGITVTHLKGKSTQPLRLGAQVEMLRSRLTYYRKVFPAPMRYALTVCRIVRLVINLVVHSAAVVLTLGLHRKLRRKWLVYATLTAWLALGRPYRWGLPDKCPKPEKAK